MGWATEHIKQQIELGKELGKKKRLEHNEKIKKKFCWFKKKEEK
jgi:hypothetical protein